MERVIFERMAEQDQHHWWFVARRRILAEVIGRVVRPPKRARVLEVGCGTGHNLAMLGRFGKLDACELDAIARGMASDRLGRPVLEARLPDLSMFKAGSYDLIALLDVLEHVPDDMGSLKEIRKLLKPGGALLLTVPANKWMWSAHDVAHHHFRRYAKGELQRLLTGAGFEVQLHTYFNSLLFPAVAAARIVGKLRGSETADDAMPGARVNGILERVFGIEASLIGRIRMPFGVSLIAVVRRPS
ncbi:MAG: class I SAM-dependent methyltransferase [Sphingomicrobium sp.]